MEKILAIAILIAFVWLAIPRLVQGQWIAPTALMPSAGQAGYGWFHFDFWNHPTLVGQPVTAQDTHFRSFRDEFGR